MNKNIKNILAVRLGGIGEVLMITPALRAIKETLPNVQITLLTLSSSKKICHFIPEIDDVIISRENYSSRDFFKLIDILSKRNFNASIVFNSYGESPFPEFMLCYLAKIPVRAGFAKEDPGKLLTRWVIDPEPLNMIRHEVRRQLDLVKELGFTTNNEKLSLRINEKVKKRAQILIDQKISGKLKNVLKQINELGYKIIMKNSEKAYGAKIKNLFALISASSVVISNNKSLIQTTSALDVPVIAFCDKYNFQTPWMVKNEVLLHEGFENIKSKSIFFQDYSCYDFPKLSYAQILKSIRKILDIKEKRIVVLHFNKGIVQPVLFGA